MSEFLDKAKKLHPAMATQLKGFRLDQGLTMRELGAVMGTPHAFIGKIENQERRLDIAEFVLYCGALGKDPLDVLACMLSEIRH